jgi:hypothetical protein
MAPPFTKTPSPAPPCAAPLKSAAPVRWNAALWHGGRELLRTAHWLAPLPPHRSLSALASQRGEEAGGERKVRVFNEPNRPALREAGANKGDGAMDTYVIVTEKIINLLQQGIVPWVRREVA